MASTLDLTSLSQRVYDLLKARILHANFRRHGRNVPVGNVFHDAEKPLRFRPRHVF